jgi:hypothetical protein
MADTDLLDQLTKSAPWLVVPATLLTAMPKLIEFWQGFTGSRDGRKSLEIERARLENLKLRLEIEAFKKEHGVSLNLEEIPTVPMTGSRAAMQAVAAGHKSAEKKLWGWLGRCSVKRPHLTRAVVGGLSVVCTWLGILALLGYVATGAIMFTEPKGEFGYYLLGGFFILLLPGMLLFKIGSSLKAQSRLLKAAAKMPAEH